MNTRTQRYIDGAKNYALADRSDPFAYNRAMTHVLNGIVAPNQYGEDCAYSADPFQETRYLPNGVAYLVTVYRNVKRV